MYKYITDDSNFYDLALDLSENKPQAVFCDLETTGLDPRQNKVVLFQIKANDQIYIYDFLKLNNEHLAYLANLLNTSKVTSVFHNTKFDWKFIYHHTGIWLNNVFDTMNCEALINAGIGRSTYSLKDLVRKYLGEEMDKEARELFLQSEKTGITENMLQYSAKDVDVLEPIYYAQLDLIKQAREEKVLKLEMDLVPVIAKMEYNGVLLDKDLWGSLAAKEQSRFDRLNETIVDGFVKEIKFDSYADAYELAKAVAFPIKNLSKKKETLLRQLTTAEVMEGWFRENVNINSTYQLQACLRLAGIDTDTTDKKALKKLDKADILDALLEKSECVKRITTYGLGVFDFISPVSGRIHTEFLNLGTATGRLSSANPINLQNIPNAPGYRESFIAQEGYDWISADYSQQEFRLVGAVSGEPKIIEAYQQGADMHTATASLIYNKPLKDIDKKERFIGKTANFTIIYGGTEWALGRNLNLEMDKSQEIIRAFHDGFKVLSTFKRKAEETILELGYSITMLGRRRYNPKKPLYMDSKQYVTFINKIKREGFNTIIQGSAADITKIAMHNIATKNPFGDKLKMLIQVHDEVNFESHKSITADAVEFIREEMEKAEQTFLGPIPAKVDVNVGSYWKH